MLFKPGSLVRVLSEPWGQALGLVKWTDHEGVWLRLGNGVVVTLQEFELDAVEYLPGSGCPASFLEELKDGAHDFPSHRDFPVPSIFHDTERGPDADEQQGGLEGGPAGQAPHAPGGPP